MLTIPSRPWSRVAWNSIAPSSYTGGHLPGDVVEAQAGEELAARVERFAGEVAAVEAEQVEGQ